MFELHTAEDTIKSNDNAGVSSNILGTFVGKSGDGEVTNENGLDISSDVWKTVFDSEDFKYGIEHGYYIGYLGHPDDPGCQDFEHACIILREAHIDDDGQVYATVDLIDTPVGRIVKSFIDAGVEFGLSVRGAGDVINNSVDPETFCFRGFDLVAFPAYKDAIPTFTEIAASSNLEDVQKYKKICASVDNNLPDINDVRSLEIIQSQFGKNSDEYKNIEKKIEDVKASDNTVDLNESKINGILDLYLDSVKANKELKQQVKQLSNELKESNRRIEASKAIYEDQTKAYKNEISLYKKDIRSINASLKESEDKYRVCADKYEEARTNISNLKKDNLIYRRKVEQSQNDADQKDSVIASLKSKNLETVESSKETKAKISNLDKQISELQNDVNSAMKLVSEYQDAYSSLYASILGTNIDNLSINNTTSVEELKQAITASTSVPVNDNSISEIEEIGSNNSGDNIITV